MTLGPQQVRQQLQERDRNLVDVLERTIDKELMDKYEGAGTIAVHLGDDIKLPKQFMLDELFARYRQAGWATATYKDDQTHGEYIEFQERNNQNNQRRW